VHTSRREKGQLLDELGADTGSGKNHAKVPPFSKTAP